MDDLISRQAAIDAVSEYATIWMSYTDDMSASDIAQEAINSAKDTMIRILKEQPTVQPERKQGKWIYGEHDVAMCNGYRCDKCGFFVPWDYQHKFIDFINDYHFCPSCGADMRGEQDGRDD